MNTSLRNVVALIAGFLAGSIINMLLVNVGPKVFPLPSGLDMTTPEGLKQAMAQMQPQHFVFPFLGHALGTFAGAWVAAKGSASRHGLFASIVALLNLAGGITAVAMFGGPAWFVAADLLLAYLPMAWLATRLARPKAAAVTPA